MFLFRITPNTTVNPMPMRAYVVPNRAPSSPVCRKSNIRFSSLPPTAPAVGPPSWFFRISASRGEDMCSQLPPPVTPSIGLRCKENVPFAGFGQHEDVRLDGFAIVALDLADESVRLGQLGESLLYLEPVGVNRVRLASN